MAKTVTRLYKQFRPEYYKLTLRPKREKMTFSGEVEISGRKVGAPSSRITLHQKGLKVAGAKITKLDKGSKFGVRVTRINRLAKFDELRLHTDQKLLPGEYKIHLKFSGQITEQMHGMYPCYFSVGGRNSKLIATQFESHSAREVFPSIDEPEAKATFDLTLHSPVGEMAISNTPALKQKKEKNNLVTSFETTPKMSTYLLAFVFGKMEYLETKTTRGTIVRTYATPENVKHTSFALDVAKRCLEFFERYFEIEYPLPKLDMVALPDFSSGAMENWGLITYREQAMLVDPKNTSLESKQYVAMVVAHEVAHQWFGNLVTMQWWTDLWLNEGFASWVEYLAVDELFPEWKMWTQFIVDDQLAGLRSDALKNTHPVEVPIGHPDEIRTIFDDISYQKGASVIHMLQSYLGAEVFRKGLVHYLKKYAYSNALTNDLWMSLEEASGKKVKSFMESWLTKPGHPLVSVKANRSNLKISQHRFFAGGPETKDQTLWQIPMNLGPDASDQLMTRANLSVRGQDLLEPLNRGHAGFYTTIYGPNLIGQLGQRVINRKLSETERLGLVNDALAAAKAGYSSTSEVLEMLGYYKSEDSSPVWDSLSLLLGDLRRVFGSDELDDYMKPYVRRLVNLQLNRLGWQPKKNEPHFDSLLRPTILGLASWSEEPSVTHKSLSLFKSMNFVEDVHPDVRSVVYHTAARHGSQREFNKLLRLYKQTSSASEKVLISGSLCSFKQSAVYEQAIGLIKTDIVRTQDISYWIVHCFANRDSKTEMWRWLKTNWVWLEKKLGTELSFARTPLYAARAFSDADFEKQYRNFFEPRLKEAFNREFNKGLETIAWQSAWRQRDAEAVKSFFSKSPQAQ